MLQTQILLITALCIPKSLSSLPYATFKLAERLFANSQMSRSWGCFRTWRSRWQSGSGNNLESPVVLLSSTVTITNYDGTCIAFNLLFDTAYYLFPFVFTTSVSKNTISLQWNIHLLGSHLTLSSSTAMSTSASMSSLFTLTQSIGAVFTAVLQALLFILVLCIQVLG